MLSKLEVALLQTSLEWENPELNRSILKQKIIALKEETDLVILPEMFTTGFTMSPKNIPISEGNKTVLWLQNMAAEKNFAIMGSIVFFENEKYYNRLFFVIPTGEYWFYNKRHTFTLAGEHKIFESGSKRLIVNYKGFKICPLICYDLRFPVWARNTEDYDVLVYVANWPKARILAWDTLLRARAIENMSYCIGVNRIGKDRLGHEYSGHTSVYNSLGETIITSKKEEVIYASLSKKHIEDTRSTLKFLEDQDLFNLEP